MSRRMRRPPLLGCPSLPPSVPALAYRASLADGQASAAIIQWRAALVATALGTNGQRLPVARALYWHTRRASRRRVANMAEAKRPRNGQLLVYYGQGKG